jgi:hypothetical protein
MTKLSKGHPTLTEIGRDITPTAEGVFPTYSLKGDVTSLLPDFDPSLALNAGYACGPKNYATLTL